MEHDHQKFDAKIPVRALPVCYSLQTGVQKTREVTLSTMIPTTGAYDVMEPISKIRAPNKNPQLSGAGKQTQLLRATWHCTRVFAMV
jgi:hypothetical protein